MKSEQETRIESWGAISLLAFMSQLIVWVLAFMQLAVIAQTRIAFAALLAVPFVFYLVYYMVTNFKN